MATFYELDKEVAAAMKKPNLPLLQKLKDLMVPTSLVDDEVKTEDADMVSLIEEEASDGDGSLGDKRKLCVIIPLAYLLGTPPPSLSLHSLEF